MMPAAIETPYNRAAETAGTAAGPSSSQTKIIFVTEPDGFLDSEGNKLTGEALEESEEEEDKVKAEIDRQIMLENNMDVNKKADLLNKARKELYEKAALAISALFKNTDDSQAIALLKETNAAIEALNIKELKDEDRNKYLIRIEMF